MAEAFQNQQQNLQETIGRLVALMKNLPEGKSQYRLLDEISCLDVIAEVMRRALDSAKMDCDRGTIRVLDGI